MKRIITGLILAGLVLANLFLIECSPHFFAVFNAIISMFCIYEVAKNIKPALPKPYYVLCGVLALLLLPSYLLLKSLYGIIVLVCLLFLIAFVIFTLSPNYSLVSLQNFVFILFYPSLLLAFIYPLIYSSNAVFLLVAVFGIGPLADTFAYAVGSIVKGKKLCPSVSPKKTISGGIGGLFGGMAAGIVIYFVFKALSFEALPSLLIMALVGFTGAIFTALGDLAESAIKRRLEIKDFGTILPGHGGVMDRMDGIMFNSIFIFTFFTYIIQLV